MVQDLREWIRNSDEGPIALRRSVATICVLWTPEVEGRQALDVDGFVKGVASCVELLRCVETQLSKLHDAGVAHCCLSPSNIFRLPGSSPQRFFLGDFVQKIRFLSLLHGHGKVDDDYESWALWQAPEVLERIQEGVRGRDKSVKARAGALLRCIWPSVRFHGDKLRLAQGDEIRVLERDGNWIRTAPGWLPLWGTRAMDYSPLFEVRQRAPPKPKPSLPPSELQREAKAPEAVPVSVLDMALQQEVASVPVPAPPGLKLELPTEPGYAPPTTWTQFEWKPDDWKSFWQGFHDAAAAPAANSGPSSPASQSSRGEFTMPAKVAFATVPETSGPLGPPGLEKEGDFLWM